jgi:hypothetical protein
VTTDTPEIARVLHRINGGSKASLAPSTTSTGKAGELDFDKHIGLYWTKESRLNFLQRKYPTMDSEQDFAELVCVAEDECSYPAIRDCCETLLNE